MADASVLIKVATPDEFGKAAEFWVAMRRELHMPDADLAPDWKARAVEYFTRRDAAGDLRWFFACAQGAPVASAAGFLLDGYPAQICVNRRVGYIAGVYVQERWRRRGLARAVTQAALDWLWQIGCRAVRLHAAEDARAIYQAMGFEASNEMIIDRRPRG